MTPTIGISSEGLRDSELLEWRNHDSACEITHTGFGPYMVERLADDRYRAWLPDDSQTARLMVEGFASGKEARAFCQRDVDGRRTLKFIADAEAAFDAEPVSEADIEASVQRMRSHLKAAIAKAEGREKPDPEDILETISDALSLESWVEGKTLTVMFDDESGQRKFAKLRLVKIADQPTATDLRGTPE